ncbi:hypothetical protein BH11MYX1_BH11MYX1_21740 [soil metagenome]
MLAEAASVLALDGCYVHANPEAVKVIGVPLNEIVGRHYLDVFPELAAPPFPAAFSRVASNESRREQIATYYAPRDAWAQQRLHRVGDQVVVLWSEVTLRGRADEALERSHERYQALVKATGHMVWTNGPDGEMRGEQPDWCAYTGQTTEECQGYGWSQAIHPDDVQPTLDAWRSVVESRGIFKFEHRVRGGDGGYRWFSIRAVPVLAGDGSIREWVGLHHDIEEIKRADRRYREAIESMGDALLVLDREWRIVAVNKNQERMAQRPRQTTLGANLWEEFPAAKHPDRKYWNAFHRVMEERVEAHFVEYYAPLEHWTEFDVVPAMDGGIAVFCRDISERKRLEKETQALYTREQEARLLAESAGRSKDEFLAMLGHELRNPLAPILTALELMSLRGTNESERERQIIGRQVDHMVRLVDDLLDVSRVTRGRIELSRQPIEIGELVARGLELVAPLLESSHHEISIHVPRHGLVVSGDANRLTQVFSNLLANAAKYTPPHGRVTITALRDENDVMVSIGDTGVGIPADLLPRVFDLFVQNSQTLDRSRGGLGIGLAIVQNLVQLHGGSVSARSDGAGTGSTFTVRLPWVTQIPVEIHRTPALPAVAPQHDRNVLIVDDNEDAAELLAETLQMLGYATRTAYDGPAALAMLQTFRPDHVLLDIGLPEMDGYEVARRVRQLPELAGLKLVALTGYGQESDRQRARAAGFDAHLVKPVNLAKLRALLDEP